MTSQIRGQSGAPFVEIVPGEVGEFILYCADDYGRIVSNCCVVIYQGSYADSGGHLHDAGRPVSTVRVDDYCYDAYRGIALDIDTGHGIGQWEYLNLCGRRCASCPVSCNLVDVWIRHWPLYDLYGDKVPPYNQPIGAVPNYHVENHFGTDLLVFAVDQITQQYYGEFYCVPDAEGIKGYQPVGVNDMSLEGGGIFDINAPRSLSLAWKPPHHWHSAGNSVDFRCQPNRDYSIIYVDEVVDRFMRVCDLNGLDYQLREDKGGSNEHVHCGVRAGN